jgi:hypothetical protein
MTVIEQPGRDAAERQRWENYIACFMAGGKLLSEADLLKATRLWVNLPEAEQLKATADAWETAKARRPEFIQLPQNHLRDKPWTRAGPGRLMAPAAVKSKSEIAQDEAARRFLSGRNWTSNY